MGFVVRISPADSAADTIKILTEAGVEQVNLFGYDFEDYDALYQNAAAKAVSDARTKAELISMRSGTELLDIVEFEVDPPCLLYTSPSPRDQRGSRMPSSA